jgi:MFS family permease
MADLPATPRSRLLSPAAGLFLGLSTFQVFAMFRRGLFYSYLSIYLHYYLGLNVTETSLFATVPMLLNVLFQTFVWGRLSDRFQKRRTLVIAGELVAAVGTVLLYFLHHRAPDRHAAGFVIIWGLTVIEVFWSMSNIGWSAYISDAYPPERRASVQGNLQSLGGLGRVLGVWAGGTFYDRFGRGYEGWGFAEGSLFFVSSAVMVISVIPMFFVPEGGIRQKQPGGIGGAAASPAPQPVTDRGWVMPFALFLVAMTLVNFGRNVTSVINSQYLVLDSGFAVSSGTLSTIINMLSLSMVVAGFAVGRWGKNARSDILLVSGTVAAMVVLVLFEAARWLGWIYIAGVFGGVSEVLISAASYAIAASLIPPEKRATLFGLFNATLFLSWGASSTLIAGPLVDALVRAGRTELVAYRASYLVGLAITGVGLVMLLAQSRTRAFRQRLSAAR